MQLAKEILGGKYEFVLTTHIDKGHIHDHLIFNVVSFANHKHYHSTKRSYHEIRRTSDQERFTRMKTLGNLLHGETITSRIAGGSRPSRQPKQRDGRISLLIDIQNNLKTQQSAVFTHWAKLNNLKQVAKTMNFLTEHWIDSYAQLTERLSAITDNQNRVHAEIKAIETRQADEACFNLSEAETDLRAIQKIG